MGLMDKFKNLFTDEEIIEEDDVDTVEIKEVKKEDEQAGKHKKQSPLAYRIRVRERRRLWARNVLKDKDGK